MSGSSRLILGVVAIVVAGAVGAFAIYTFGWHNSSTNDRTVALIDAHAAEINFPSRHLSSVDEMTAGYWRARYVRAGGGEAICQAINLARFAVNGNYSVQGTSFVPCP